MEILWKALETSKKGLELKGSLVNQRKKKDEISPLKTEHWSPNRILPQFTFLVNQRKKTWKSKSWISLHFWRPGSEKNEFARKKAELAGKCCEKRQKFCEMKRQNWHDNIFCFKQTDRDSIIVCGAHRTTAWRGNSNVVMFRSFWTTKNVKQTTRGKTCVLLVTLFCVSLQVEILTEDPTPINMDMLKDYARQDVKKLKQHNLAPHQEIPQVVLSTLNILMKYEGLRQWVMYCFFHSFSFFFLRFCWTRTKWYLITLQTRVKCVSRKTRAPDDSQIDCFFQQRKNLSLFGTVS